MKLWMLPWLLPVGMLAGVVFVSVFDSYSALVALSPAFAAVPFLLRSRFPASDDPDADVKYRRIRRP